MLRFQKFPITDDDYDPDESLRNYPRIQNCLIKMLTKLSSDIQELLRSEPDGRINLGELPAKYQKFFRRDLDKLGHSKLILLMEKLPGPVKLERLATKGARISLIELGDQEWLEDSRFEA